MTAPDEARPSVIVLMAVFNRRDTTLRSLEGLFAQQAIDHVDLSVVLLDDGSTDGTADAVSERFPSVQVLVGDGNMYWNGGMRHAWVTAWARDPDFWMWLNDDTILRPDAVAELLRVHDLVTTTNEPAIVAGPTVDPDSGRVNYSGVEPDRFRPLRYELVEPNGTPQRVASMNGNAVLIPRAVATRVGVLSASYTHSMGDFDYGRRAGAAGCAVWVTPAPVATCQSNPDLVPQGELRDWARFREVKQLPMNEWQVFAKRWGGPAWPVFWLSPYVRWAGSIARQAVTRVKAPSPG